MNFMFILPHIPLVIYIGWTFCSSILWLWWYFHCYPLKSVHCRRCGWRSPNQMNFSDFVLGQCIELYRPPLSPDDCRDIHIRPYCCEEKIDKFAQKIIFAIIFSMLKEVGLTCAMSVQYFYCFFDNLVCNSTWNVDWQGQHPLLAHPTELTAAQRSIGMHERFNEFSYFSTWWM